MQFVIAECRKNHNVMYFRVLSVINPAVFDGSIANAAERGLT